MLNSISYSNKFPYCIYNQPKYKKLASLKSYIPVRKAKMDKIQIQIPLQSEKWTDSVPGSACYGFVLSCFSRKIMNIGWEKWQSVGLKKPGLATER